MKVRSIFGVALCVLVLGTMSLPSAAPVVASPGKRTEIAVTADTSLADARSTIALIESMIAAGELRLIDQRDDTLLEGRTHQRYQQTYRGLPVLGADVTWQKRGSQVLSAFGIVFQGLAIDTEVHLPFAQIRSTLVSRGMTVVQGAVPLSILPMPNGTVELVYSVSDTDGRLHYVSARDASVVLELNNLHKQSAVGQGTGALGDSKKISVTSVGGSFVSRDSLRPPALETFDLRGNTNRLIALASGLAEPAASDLAVQATNVWTDSAVVDAHVHAGWVYDYYYRRFQRRGLDNNDVRIHSYVHPVRLDNIRNASADEVGLLYLNAFYSRNCRCMVYGEGIPPGFLTAFPNGVRNFATALDVVGHELTHAVTDASSRLIYANESGALNEAFSDIMATGVEYFFQTSGTGPLRADYLIGEDLAPTGTGLTRSMSAPTTTGQPDHYYLRQAIGAVTSDFDSGGVHINSGIANNAFYLAIEGGTHRYSGVPVVGVGAANREQVERAFYRAFTAMLPSSSTFFMARTATIQSARDLFGIGSNAERAITSAWSAVGVNNPGAALTTQFLPRSVPANAGACSAGGAQPSFTFRVNTSEFQQVGFTVQQLQIVSYDAQIRVIGNSTFPASTFASWFSECSPGNTRIGPGATVCATLCGSLGGRANGYAVLVFTGVDDNGNLGQFNSIVLSMGLPARSDAEDTGGTPVFTKVVPQ